MQDNRLHVIYLAVDPQMQHHGIAVKLLKAAVDYADKHHMNDVAGDPQPQQRDAIPAVGV